MGEDIVVKPSDVAGLSEAQKSLAKAPSCMEHLHARAPRRNPTHALLHTSMRDKGISCPVCWNL